MVRFINFLTVVSLVSAALLISPAVAVDKGDLTGDGFVDIDDVAVMADGWLTDDPGPILLQLTAIPMSVYLTVTVLLI